MRSPMRKSKSGPRRRRTGADYAIVWKPPPQLWPDLAGVKAIFNLGAGVDAIACQTALPRDVQLVRLEDAGMAQQMAEYVCHAVLRRYREFDCYAEQQREGVWLARPRANKQRFGVGILGLGLLGMAVAAALLPFGFPLPGWSRTAKQRAGIASFAGASELDAFLASGAGPGVPAAAHA